MSGRFMRMMVFFDLPVATHEDRRHYSEFRRFLVKSGFMMMQESVYCKILQNGTAVAAAASAVRLHKPPKGLIQMMTVTEAQFARMEYVVGEKKSEIIDTDERLVVL